MPPQDWGWNVCKFFSCQYAQSHSSKTSSVEVLLYFVIFFCGYPVAIAIFLPVFFLLSIPKPDSSIYFQNFFLLTVLIGLFWIKKTPATYNQFYSPKKQFFPESSVFTFFFLSFLIIFLYWNHFDLNLTMEMLKHISATFIFSIHYLSFPSHLHFRLS